jgi:tRNA (mo5U34)-methyltransferase
MKGHDQEASGPTFDSDFFVARMSEFEAQYSPAETQSLQAELGGKFPPSVEITMDDVLANYPHYAALLVEHPVLATFVSKYLDQLRPFLQAPFPLPDGTVIQGPWVAQYKLHYFEQCGLDRDTVANKTVLDVGCNAGFDTFYLSTLGPKKIVGIDPTALWHYQALLLWSVYYSPNVQFRKIGWQDLEPRDEKFDIINCQGVLYHEPSPLALLDSLFNLLTPGGYLVLETHVTLDNDAKALFVEKAFWGDTSWFWVPSVETVCAMLRSYGYEDIVVRDQFSVPSQNPDDPFHTVEGNPVGGRAFFTARRPLAESVHRSKFGWS